MFVDFAIIVCYRGADSKRAQHIRNVEWMLKDAHLTDSDSALEGICNLLSAKERLQALLKG
jgi:hypothetical protein